MRLSYKLDEKEAIMPQPGEPLPDMNMYPIMVDYLDDGEGPKHETSVKVSN